MKKRKDSSVNGYLSIVKELLSYELNYADPGIASIGNQVSTLLKREQDFDGCILLFEYDKYSPGKCQN